MPPIGPPPIKSAIQAFELAEEAYREKRFSVGEQHYLAALNPSNGTLTARQEASAFFGLGKIYYKGHEYARSLLFLERASRFFLDSQEDVDEAANCLCWIGNCLNKLERPKAAEEYHKKEWSLLSKHRGYDHPEALDALEQVARRLSDRGKLDAAGKKFEKLIVYAKKAFGEEAKEFACVLKAYATFNRTRENYEQSEALGLRALEIFEKLPREDDADYIDALESLGVTYKRAGKFEQAESYYLRARREIESKEKNRNAWTNNCGNLGRLYLAWGKHAEAISMFNSTVELYLEHQCGSWWELFCALKNLAHVFEDEKHFDLAFNCLEQCLEIHRHMYLHSDNEALALLETLADLAAAGGDKLKEDWVRELLAHYRGSGPSGTKGSGAG